MQKHKYAFNNKHILIVVHAIEGQEVGCASVWEDSPNCIFGGVDLNSVTELFWVHLAKEAKEVCSQANNMRGCHRSTRVDLLYFVSMNLSAENERERLTYLLPGQVELMASPGAKASTKNP
jgi:hypothetical protein